jgi:hypothetical protein
MSRLMQQHMEHALHHSARGRQQGSTGTTRVWARGSNLSAHRACASPQRAWKALVIGPLLLAIGGQGVVPHVGIPSRLLAELRQDPRRYVPGHMLLTQAAYSCCSDRTTHESRRQKKTRRTGGVEKLYRQAGEEKGGRVDAWILSRKWQWFNKIGEERTERER